jgi:ComF family protein
VRIADLVTLAAPPLCWECGAPSRGDALCRPCRTALRWLGQSPVEVAGVRAWAPVAYDGPARALVHALKFRGAAGVAEAMAAQIVAGVPRSLVDRGALVPVPLHQARLRRRGFNQAERLAAAIARRAALPRVSCLERRRRAAPQVGRPRALRLASVRGTVAVRSDHEVPDRALLVDDVVTTGGTLAACAAALRSAGTREVAALAYARTPPR